MLLSLIVIGVSVYLIADTIKYLSGIPLEQWVWWNWALVLMCVALVVLIVMNARTVWKQSIKKSAEYKETMAKEEAKLRAKRRAVYFADEETEPEESVSEPAKTPTGTDDPDGAERETHAEDAGAITQNDSLEP